MEDQPKRGIVYILTNEAMEGYLKIGMTSGDTPDRVRQRMRELDSTGVPRPFHCEYAAVVEDAANVERGLHTAFGDRRVRSNREFFQDIEPFRVIAALQMIAQADVTPDASALTSEEVTEKPPRRPPFNFGHVRINAGAELQFIKSFDVTCTVVNEKQVQFRGETMSLSRAADLALGKPLGSVAGPQYWMFEEETLSERRRRMEETGDE